MRYVIGVLLIPLLAGSPPATAQSAGFCDVIKRVVAGDPVINRKVPSTEAGAAGIPDRIKLPGAQKTYAANGGYTAYVDTGPEPTFESYERYIQLVRSCFPGQPYREESCGGHCKSTIWRVPGGKSVGVTTASMPRQSHTSVSVGPTR